MFGDIFPRLNSYLPRLFSRLFKIVHLTPFFRFSGFVARASDFGLLIGFMPDLMIGVLPTGFPAHTLKRLSTGPETALTARDRADPDFHHHF